MSGELVERDLQRLGARQVGVGAGALALARLVDHGLAFASRLIVARAVGPEEFAAVAVALLVVTLLDSMTESGLVAAVIHADAVDERDARVVFGVNIARGISLAVALGVLAPTIGRWFATPDASDVIRIMALVLLMRGLSSPGLMLSERSVRFRPVVECGIVRACVTFTVTLLALSLDLGAVALAWGLVVGETAATLMSHVFAPFRHLPAWDPTRLRALARYGKWITASSVALLIQLQVDDVVVGIELPPSDLALYQMAYLLACAPAIEVALVLNRVAFPSLARLRSDRERMVTAFLRGIEVISVLALVFAAALAVEADRVVAALLGPAWAPAVPALRVLAMWGALRAIGASTTPLLRAIGRPALIAGYHWAVVLPTMVLIVPLTRAGGIEGAALAVLVPALVVSMWRYPVVMRSAERPVSDLLQRFRPGILAAGAFALSALLVRWGVTHQMPPISALALEAVLGVTSALLLLGVMSKRGSAEILTTARLFLVRRP